LDRAQERGGKSHQYNPLFIEDDHLLWGKVLDMEDKLTTTAPDGVLAQIKLGVRDGFNLEAPMGLTEISGKQ
jgi:hypothetical protein